MYKVAKDKILHIFIGATFSASGSHGGAALGSYLLPDLNLLIIAALGAQVGMAAGITAGVLKEDWDRKRPRTQTNDGWDAEATSLGAAMYSFAYTVTTLVMML